MDPDKAPNALLDKYEKYLLFARRLKPITVSRYVRYARDWIIYLRAMGRTLRTARPEDALDWWSRHARRLDGNTLAKILTAMKSFYTWLQVDQGKRAPQFLFLGYQADTHPARQRPYISQEDALRLLSLPINPEGTDIRDLAYWAFLYSTLARHASALEVHLEDLRPDRHRVWLRKTKFDQPYEALLTEEAWAYLEFYLREVRPVWTNRYSGTYVWLSKRGRPWDRESARLAIRGLSERIGLIDPVSPHGIRHSGATHLEENGADLYTIMEMLGHHQVSSTERYVHVNHSRKLREGEAVHPMQSLRRLLVVERSNQAG